VRARRPSFARHVGLTAGAGLLLTVAALTRLAPADLRRMGWSLVVLAALVGLAEIRPLVTPRTKQAGGLPLSSAFVFALLIHWGLPTALLVQGVATVAADLARRRPVWRSAFDVGQQALAWCSAAIVLALAGSLGSPAHPEVPAGADLPAILVAGTCCFLVSEILVGRAIAAYDGSAVRAAVRADIRSRAATAGTLLGLAPVVVVVVDHGPALVPLLALPLVAVYTTAAVSVDRDHQAMHDALTGLPNRKLLLQRADEQLAAALAGHRTAALLLLDLDRFKEVNDTLGHQVGDDLLQQVASRLIATVRPHDTVARLGGDEFAVLLPAIDHPGRALDVAQRMRRALSEPFRRGELTFDVDVSVGIALCPQHGDDVAALLQRADVAMYLAKETGSGVEVYAPDRDRHSAARLEMLGELREALARGEVVVHYQPKIDLRDGAVSGVEALLRWPHPTRGLLSAAEFLPMAEQAGLTRVITPYVLDAATAQAARWWQTGVRVPVAVNVSARDLYDGHLAEVVGECIARHGVPGNALALEVTESVLMSDLARAGETLHRLAALGVGVSLDDFGTGYSSLVHLTQLPVSEIKVDRSFVHRMAAHAGDAAIVRTIVDLGSALGVRVVAEGVEDSDAWDRLAVLGCDAVQGWYVSDALPADEVTAWLSRVASVGAHLD